MVSVHTSLQAFETLDTRANNTELRAEKYTKKRGEEKRDRESTREGRLEEIKMRGGEKKRFFSTYDQAVIQDERALICT